MEIDAINLGDNDPRATLVQAVLADDDVPLFNLISDVMSISAMSNPDELLEGPDRKTYISLPVSVMEIIDRRMNSFIKSRQHAAKSFFIKTLIVRGIKGCLNDFERRGDIDWHRETMMKILTVLGIDYDDTMLEGPSKSQE